MNRYAVPSASAMYLAQKVGRINNLLRQRRRLPVAWGRRSLTIDRRGARQRFGSVALAGVRREEFLELSVDPVELLGVRGRLLLRGDVGPFVGVFGVELQPFVEAGLGVGLDGIGRTFGLAHAAIDA